MYKPSVVAALLTTLPAMSALAAEPGADLWSVNGYGTLGLVHSTEDRADYLPNVFHPDGPGRSETVSLGVDSRLAAQLSVHPTPRLSAYVQVVSEQDSDGSYAPRVEWANVQYELTRNVSIRAGRTTLDTFLVSNHRKVGYAIPWVRPPAEVYQLLPVSSSDGADLSYHWSRGDVTYAGQFAYGRSKGDGVEGDGWSWSNSVEWGPALFHVSYTRAKVEVEEIDPLFAAIEQFGPEGLAISRRYDPNNEPINILTVGASYDPGGWFLMAEWGQFETRSVFGHLRAGYLSGGYRIGRITPYLTYAGADRAHDPEVDGLTVSAYPPALAAQAAALNAALGALRTYGPVQETVTLGTRWDVAPSLALKAQYDRVDVDEGSNGTFRNMEPGYLPDGAHVFSLSLDFLF